MWKESNISRHQSESRGRSCNRTDVFFHFKNSRREMNEQDLPEQRRPSVEGDGVGGACCSVGGGACRSVRPPESRQSTRAAGARGRRSGPLRSLEGSLPSLPSLPSRPTTSDCPSTAGGVNIPCKPQREGSVSATHRRKHLVSAFSGALPFVLRATATSCCGDFVIISLNAKQENLPVKTFSDCNLPSCQ